MDNAERHQYAVGYFESWNMESLLAVADAAEAERSPVILGFSGISLPNPGRSRPEHLEEYAAMGKAVAERLSMPACLLFNECASMEWIARAGRLGFGLLMFSDDECDPRQLLEQTRNVARLAHEAAAAAEGEPDALPGIAGNLVSAPARQRLTDPQAAKVFARETGIDCLAVNVGQAHLHGKEQVRLHLDRLEEIHAAVDIPLALHGATSLSWDDLREGVRRGVRKVNVGSVLKRTFFETLRASCQAIGSAYNPYEVLGSGLPRDVLQTAREALARVVREYMRVLGSAGRG
jgi:fructose/tagatose bisphosphate aldolase